MRERITFIQKLGDSLDPAEVKVDRNVIKAPDVQAVREDRLSLALDELPAELQSLLNGLHELHIRWVSPIAYEAISPLLARLPPGFHVFFTPGNEIKATSTKPCETLAHVFGPQVSCSTPGDSFTALPNDRFSHSAAFQYFRPLDTLAPFIKYAESQLCSDKSCTDRLSALSSASTLDISYDTISHSLRITATWPYQRQKVHATARPNSRTEVGILSGDKPKTLEPHELGISGLLTVLGQDDKPSVAMFTFPSRHRDAESSFSAKFLSPTGLHPTLQLSLSSSKPPPGVAEDTCTPHAYLTLPNTIFPDKYQLSDPLFLASKNLTALRYVSSPIDLEAPDYVLKSWGSTVLLELSPPSAAAAATTAAGGGEWTVEIPLHLRYLAPSFTGYATVNAPYPAVFWACTAEEGTKFPNNPFEKVNLGYDGLFGPRTVFWHVEPKPVRGRELVNKVRVPVLDLSKAEWVNVGTAVAVLLGFLWVVWRLGGVVFGKTKKAAAEEKKKQ
ncbi:protein pbn1 [Cladorrhinum samala]|uniref:Protein PBN1 n=1 Tax=Cladorrhinum samala TaxID=585594 RepID=A0AAV9HEA2_9PEZI|nr:protein pbn1 [Cladorrhinum samala]